MRQQKVGSHTPPCHRRMVITTLFSVLLAALQRRPVLYHTRWLPTVHWLLSRKGGGVPLLRATEIFQNTPWGGSLDVQKCVFVHFLGMQKEIGGCFASKVTDLCMLT